jgi:CelD/BcsL family acetyltransferase involved in cellulose biosynthesis
VDPAERSEWSELARRSGSIYATPEWLETWWRHFGDGRRVTVIRCRNSDGRLVAILPIYLWSSFPLRVLRLVGHGPSDALGPVGAPEDRRSVVPALQKLLESERIGVFVGEEMHQEEGWADLLGARTLRRRPSPLLRIDGRRWEDFLKGLRPSTRKQVKEGERRLLRLGFSYRLTHDPQELPRDLDALFALHAERFPRGTSQFGWDTKVQAFHREFAQQALDRGWLRLWFLERDGVPVSVQYTFSFAGSHYSYNGGWLPEYANVSVGRVLLLHTIRQAFGEGAAEFRFLRGGEAYKYRFATDDRPVDTVAVTRGFAPASALSAYFRLWTLRRAFARRKLRARARDRSPGAR